MVLRVTMKGQKMKGTLKIYKIAETISINARKNKYVNRGDRRLRLAQQFVANTILSRSHQSIKHQIDFDCYYDE